MGRWVGGLTPPGVVGGWDFEMWVGRFGLGKVPLNESAILTISAPQKCPKWSIFGGNFFLMMLCVGLKIHHFGSATVQVGVCHFDRKGCRTSLVGPPPKRRHEPPAVSVSPHRPRHVLPQTRVRHAAAGGRAGAPRPRHLRQRAEGPADLLPRCGATLAGRLDGARPRYGWSRVTGWAAVGSQGSRMTGVQPAPTPPRDGGGGGTRVSLWPLLSPWGLFGVAGEVQAQEWLLRWLQDILDAKSTHDYLQVCACCRLVQCWFQSQWLCETDRQAEE